MENPYGLCDAAFARVSPDELADTVIKAADNKRRNSITTNSREPSRLEDCISPPAHVTPAAAHYDIYHAKAPKGWSGTTPIVDNTAVTTSTAPVVSRNIQQDVRPNGYTPAKKMVFQNFNATPRLWKGTSAY
ncbi:uncharacterized protein LOC118180183 [Stegodyphus dumicola]|uniref:uncharacterized protein LOC118180183 n=1 Tax=Stegodyphus dumicola TaxID=202533 RepID=UPI0015B012C8|nr:uncharacterized protein LOC118180183 [Stegodyphus dumicola]